MEQKAIVIRDSGIDGSPRHTSAFRGKPNPFTIHHSLLTSG